MPQKSQQSDRPERSIERSFVRRAEALGCKTRKLNGPGHVAWHDRLVLVPGGEFALIEFKRPGGSLSRTQDAFHDDLNNMGHAKNSHVFDNWQDAIALVRRLMR
jgi:hypothetical protein